jgi:hypothetical protein
MPTLAKNARVGQPRFSRVGQPPLKLYQEAITGPLERPLAARAHFHIGEVLYDRSEFSRALDEFKIAETLADPGSSDKDHFAGWVKHTLRAAGVPE